MCFVKRQKNIFVIVVYPHTYTHTVTQHKQTTNNILTDFTSNKKTKTNTFTDFTSSRRGGRTSESVRQFKMVGPYCQIIQSTQANVLNCLIIKFGRWEVSDNI